ncbi:LamB/YcsF family protein [Rhizobium cremeum]|uniref:LamB/YcsF family protein n=1 Tax=Rhizobium cremeum TaxID=2813827 RepID=UPI001FD105E3|nr:5-oxoprolinase subunit PxpA [Rhizobium cremeum]MCJ7995016.1 LamB/YcsF family protein [Rhizobium cremeum]MCJ8000672.1 LamB/YcsF family protein [Rhizobium cremeum]
MSLSVDLNSDMGEGFGAYRMGDDAAMLSIVSSANIACGLHAGDPEIMAQTFALAKEKGVAVGAHPGFPDLWGFGRRNIPFSAGEIERLVAYQIGAAQALATYVGHPITHVKAHGALGNLTQQDESVARAVNNAIKAVDPKLVCLTIALGHQERLAREMGLACRSEIFADRAYTDEGFLVHRSKPGAVIHDAATAAERVVRMVRNGAIETITGRAIVTPIDSICVHSDTPSAVGIAARVRAGLEDAGITIRNFLR